jgi:hypothetical protein
MTAQLPPSPLPSAFLAWPGGIFLSFRCSEEASGEDVLWPLPPFVPPAVSTCAVAVEVLLDVALPLPLALPPLALVAVLWDAAVDDRPVLALGEAPPAEPLPDPLPLGDGLAALAPPAGEVLPDLGASDPPPLGRRVLAWRAATVEAGVVALLLAWRRPAWGAGTRDCADGDTGPEGVTGAAEGGRAGALTRANRPKPSNARPDGVTSLMISGRPPPAPMPRVGHA